MRPGIDTWHVVLVWNDTWHRVAASTPGSSTGIDAYLDRLAAKSPVIGSHLP